MLFPEALKASKLKSKNPNVTNTSFDLVRTAIQCFNLFDKRAQRQLIFLLVLMVIGAVLEALGAAIIVPFVAMLDNPSLITSNPVLQEIYLFSKAGTPTRFISLMSVLLLAYFLFKNFYLTWSINAQYKFVYSQMPGFSSELLSRYIHQPISEHYKKNSSEMLRNVGNEVFMYFNNFVIPAMTLVTELMVMVAMIVVLLWTALVPTVVALFILGGLTLVFYRVVRSRARHFGQEQQAHNSERIKWITQGLASIKEIKILGCEKFFTDRFNVHEDKFALAARYSMFLNQTPRLFIETVSFAALFLSVGFATSTGQDLTSILPLLALFAIAAVRLLPSLNRILLSVTRLTYYKATALVVIDAKKMMDCVSSNGDNNYFEDLKDWQEIKFEGVSFSFTKENFLFDLNLSIKKGTSVALIGPSGCGKSTMADLVMGLLKPTTGRILLDNQDINCLGASWQKRIGYVPQSVYLIDDSIRRNVAFGLKDEEIDDDQVWRALRLAQLDKYVSLLPQQILSCVGENGNRLSGGQRQRLGIARALYRDPEFIVLDEATSALDTATEKEIADTLDELTGKKTLLIIAHRPETMNRCQHKFMVNEKRFLL